MIGQERKPDTPSQIQLELTELAHGPYAIGRHSGQVVLVRGGVPGDRVSAHVTRWHARHLEAEVTAVIQAGPARRIPPCPYVGTCGGCSWQQVDYPAQLAAKAASAMREFARLGVPPAVLAPPIAAPSEWGYRRRIRWHGDRRGRIGYFQAGSRAVVEVDSCIIAEPALSQILPAARRLGRGLTVPVIELELLTRGELPGVVAAIAVGEAPGHRDRAHVERVLAAEPGLAGVVVAGRGFLRTFGDVRVRLAAPDGFQTDVSPLAFSQVNPAGNALLVSAVLALAAPDPAARVLELHAGAGNFTAALGPRVQALHAVERDRFGVEALRRLAGRVPGITVERAGAGEALRHLAAARTPFDLVVADPPRVGLREELGGILALGPRRFIYIACDLATLVRDTRALQAGGYGLTRLQLVDLFPQTHHAEFVARFDATPASP
jgi:23S rRNA (uracil1939-C5)-methyltransferase